MIAKDIIDIAKATVLTQLPVKTNDSAVLFCVYLGLLELYKRFNLSVKTEIVQTIEETSVYDLRNPDLTQVLEVYDSNKKQLVSASLVDDKDYDFKQLNFRSFLLTHPKNEYLLFVYKAAPLMLKSENDPLDIPLDFINPLLDFIAFRCHSTINKDNINEAQVYYMRFEQGCKQLEQQGYKVNLATASLSVQSKGFV